MTANIFVSATWLNVTNNHGYGLLPIPSARDEEISALIRQWMALDSKERQEAAKSIKDEQSGTFLAYSERMASRAVRESNRDWILLGLIAQGLDGWRMDYRENIVILALHYDAAERIRVSAKSVFMEASSWLSPDVGTALVTFSKRVPEDRSLKAMGYEASHDASGFLYKRTW
ncbi:MAG: hypothetical protein ACJ8NR_02595 [Sulfurifustis sp.]